MTDGRLRRLPPDDRIFANIAPMIFSRLTVAAYHTMAGDQQCYGVLPNGRTHGAHRLRVVEPPRHPGIGGQTPHRDFQQGLPDLDLERGALQMQFELRRLVPVTGKDRQRLLLLRVGSGVVMRMRETFFQIA